MQVDETLETMIADAAVYEDDLTLNERPALTLCRNAFMHRFNIDPKFYTLLKDLQYYQGGYPSPDSPPKIDTFIEKVAEVAKWYNALGKLDEFNAALQSACGMKIVETTAYVDPTSVPSASPAKAEKYLEKIDPSKAYENMTPPDLAQYLLDEGCNVQGRICHKADQIKITIGEQVKAKYDIEPSRFRDIVRVQSKINLAKDPTKIIESNERTGEQVDKVVSVSDTIVNRNKND